MICPSCGSWVDEGDAVCPGCGASFSYAYNESDEYECPKCRNRFQIDEFDTECRFCGAPIEREEDYY